MNNKPSLLSRRRIILALISLVVSWYAGSYWRGMSMAIIDYTCGHYEVKTYGYPPGSRWEYARLLRERYDVKLKSVAGCVVSPDEEWYVGGYNSVSERLLLAKYQKDIFAECFTEAEQQWRAEHPEEW